MKTQFWTETSVCLDEVEKEKKRLKRDSIDLDTLSSVRENINHRLEILRLGYEQSLEKQYASLALFAVVAFIDEDIQRHLLNMNQGNWDPLQKDFYGAYNAGELFYETIDKTIDDVQVPSIVLEVFYFILKKGFLGKYRDSKTHITKYLDILKGKIEVVSPEQIGSQGSKEVEITKRRFKKWHYYTGAVALSFCLLVTLYIASSL